MPPSLLLGLERNPNGGWVRERKGEKKEVEVGWLRLLSDEVKKRERNRGEKFEGTLAFLRSLMVAM